MAMAVASFLASLDRLLPCAARGPDRWADSGHRDAFPSVKNENLSLWRVSVTGSRRTGYAYV